MPYSVCCLNQPSFLENIDLSIGKEKLCLGSSKGYSLADMIQKYESVPLSYPKWLASKMILNGGDVVLQLDSFNEYFGTQIFRYLDSFRQIRVIGQTKQSSFKIKAALRNVLPNVQFPKSLDYYTEPHAVDAVYAVARTVNQGVIEPTFLSEVLFTLTNNGVFYLTCIIKDYDVTIHQLYKEFDCSYMMEARDSVEFLESKFYLSRYFNSIEVHDFTSTMSITCADDLIGYILSNDNYSQLKRLIAQNGLSKFRNFLANKIHEDGGLFFERQIKLLMCYK